MTDSLIFLLLFFGGLVVLCVSIWGICEVIDKILDAMWNRAKRKDQILRAILSNVSGAFDEYSKAFGEWASCRWAIEDLTNPETNKFKPAAEVIAREIQAEQHREQYAQLQARAQEKHRLYEETVQFLKIYCKQKHYVRWGE